MSHSTAGTAGLFHVVTESGGNSLHGTLVWRYQSRDLIPFRISTGYPAFPNRYFEEGRLGFYRQLRELAHPVRFEDWVKSLKHKKWVVYAKPPFGGPEQVLRYLARYTHRVAISNGRLLSLQDGKARFRWRDSQDHNQIKEMSLDAVEFIRRFLIHVLPSGFVKIRHFGFLSNRNRKAMVQKCRELLPTVAPVAPIVTPDDHLCPVCKIGHLHVVEWQPYYPGLTVTANSRA